MKTAPMQIELHRGRLFILLLMQHTRQAEKVLGTYINPLCTHLLYFPVVCQFPIFHLDFHYASLTHIYK